MLSRSRRLVATISRQFTRVGRAYMDILIHMIIPMVTTIRIPITAILRSSTDSASAATDMERNISVDRSSADQRGADRSGMDRLDMGPSAMKEAAMAAAAMKAAVMEAAAMAEAAVTDRLTLRNRGKFPPVTTNTCIRVSVAAASLNIPVRLLRRR